MKTLSISGETKTVSISGASSEPKTVSISGTPKEVSISAAPKSDNTGLFGTSFGTATNPFPGSGFLGRQLGISGPDASEAVLRAAQEPGQRARKGFGEIIDLAVPAPSQSNSIVRSQADVGRSIARDFLHVGSDFTAGSIDPESGVVAALGPIARPFIGPIAKGAKFLGKKIAEKAPALARPFVYRFGQPEAYKTMAENRIGAIGLGSEKAGETGKLLSEGLSQAEQQRVGQIIKGGLSTGQKEAPLREIATKAKDQLTKLGSQAVEEGLLDEKTYLKNVEKYMPRLYRKYEQATTSMPEVFGSKPQRILGKRFLQRQEIPEEVRNFMGEIKEPAYPVARGIAQITHDVETAKLFRNVAGKAEWASAAPIEGFIKMESTKRLGPLAGKYVHPEIARDINDIIRVPSDAEKMYKDMLHAWKFGKVILNPATHARNSWSNIILMDVVGGVDLLRQPMRIKQATQDLLKKGKWFKEARDADLLGHGYAAAEINGFLDNFDKPAETVFGKLLNAPKKIGRLAGETYQTEEKIFKLATFIDARESGLGIKEAAALSEKALFNYDKVSPFIKGLRNSPFGAPFITFTSKAIPAIAEAGIKHPMRLYKYKILFDSMENMAREKFDLSDHEVNTIKRNQRGSVVILPFKDKGGHLQTLDLSYILPWGDIGEQGGLDPLPPSMTPGGLVKPIGEALMFNKSMFKAGSSKFDPVKAQIYLDSDDEPTKWKKKIDYLYKSFMPSFAPPIPSYSPKKGFKISGISEGGYHTQKLINTQEGRADYFGRVRSLATVMADIMLGLKASPVDPKIMERFERVGIAKELKEIRTEVKNKYRNMGLSEEKKKEARQVMIEKAEQLLLRKSEMEE